MVENFNSRQEIDLIDPNVAQLFERMNNIDLSLFITPDGFIKSEMRDLLGPLVFSMEKLLGRLFEGHKCTREWNKIVPELQKIVNSISNKGYQSDTHIPIINIPNAPIIHWSAKEREAKEKLPPGVPNRLKHGSTPRNAFPGDRGKGRYSKR